MILSIVITLACFAITLIIIGWNHAWEESGWLLAMSLVVGAVISLIIGLTLMFASIGADTTTTLVETIPLAQIETEDSTQICYLAVNEKYLSESSKRYYYFAEKNNINSLECSYFSTDNIKYLTDNTQPYIEVYKIEYANKFLRWYFGNESERHNKIIYIPKNSIVKVGIPEYLKLAE